MIPALSVLQILWSSLWWCMSPQKIFFIFITYLLEDEQELSLGMLIHCKCIYNFWCSMLGFIHFLVFCSNFGVLFIWFLGLTYQQEPQCQLPVFCCFWFQESQKMNILGIGRDKSQSQFFTEGHPEPEYEMEKGHRAATPPGRVARPGPRQGVVWPAQAPHRPLLPPIRCPRYRNPKYPIKIPRKSL